MKLHLITAVTALFLTIMGVAFIAHREARSLLEIDKLQNEKIVLLMRQQQALANKLRDMQSRSDKVYRPLGTPSLEEKINALRAPAWDSLPSAMTIRLHEERSRQLGDAEKLLYGR